MLLSCPVVHLLYLSVFLSDCTLIVTLFSCRIILCLYCNCTSNSPCNCILTQLWLSFNQSELLHLGIKPMKYLSCCWIGQVNANYSDFKLFAISWSLGVFVFRKPYRDTGDTSHGPYQTMTPSLDKNYYIRRYLLSKWSYSSKKQVINLSSHLVISTPR